MKKSIVLLGRILFSLIFLEAVPNHFSAMGVGYAAAQGVPIPNVLVPISGILALLGGLSIVTGFKAKWGAWLIVLFLVPVSFMMHNFWAVADPMMRQMQMVNFMKNMSMIGGALMITYFGAGPLSIDSWLDGRRQRAHVRHDSYRREKEDIPAVEKHRVES